jgi:hypothetical protein
MRPLWDHHRGSDLPQRGHHSPRHPGSKNLSPSGLTGILALGGGIPAWVTW